MAERQVSLLRALRDGWDWMLHMLWRPFDLGKWFVLGFSAWLAGLASWGGGGGGSISDDSGGEEIAQGVQSAWEWLQENEAMAALIAAVAVFVVVVVVAMLWISSRGKFIFLDNVVHDRAHIVEPWKRFRAQGNSLFLFRIAVAFLAVPITLLVLALFVFMAFYDGGWAHLEGAAAVTGAVLTGLVGLFLLLVTLYLFFFLDAFVLPLMHRYDLGVVDGWRRFMKIFTAHPFWFLASGLFVYGLFMLAFGIVLLTGIMTCCLGFLFLSIPYLGTVLLLPLIVTYRAFTLAFLGQFDDRLQLSARAPGLESP